MKKIGVILLIGLICIMMVACKKQENVGNAEEQKPVQEIVKNPSEQLPIIYTQIEDGAGKLQIATPFSNTYLSWIL